MVPRISNSFAVTSALFLIALASARADETISSPNGRIKVQLKAPMSSAGPTWSARFRGRQLFSECRLNLKLESAGDVLSRAKVATTKIKTVRKCVPIKFGRASAGWDAYREARQTYTGSSGVRVDVVFRCYDDAIAIRYEIPKQGGLDRFLLEDELTSFAAVGDPTAYAQYLENFRTSHEHHVTKVGWNALKPDVLVDVPLTLRWKDGTYAAITEAALRKYAGMSLRRPVGTNTEVTCALSPRADSKKVIRELPVQTPWRVVLIGDRPGALLESNTIYCLNEPSVIGDSTWIRPDGITFSWWNGDVYDGKRGAPILSLESQKKYIDFCARNRIRYHGVIADETVTPWYHQSVKGVVPGPDTDVTRVRDDLDLKAIRAYADSKGVKLWTWVHQGALKGRVEEAFAAFEKLGWKGMMVDFFDRDDQETVEYVEEILAAAARHHILIHLHGIYKPTGLQRTYPNLMNHEGALNLEYLKWSDLCTPEHDLMMAFTRLVAGPMDYHLGGFRAVPKSQFKPVNIAPNVLGTRCHMLGMYVCWDNPTPMLADYPTAYEGQPGFDFLRAVPTYWDETRVLMGEPGKLLVTARRKGKEWYIGGIAAGAGQAVKVPLSILKDVYYVAEIWRDSPGQDPNELIHETRPLRADQSLTIPTALDGGFVVRLRPSRN
jgi:alpha-glucosidase